MSRRNKKRKVWIEHRGNPGQEGLDMTLEEFDELEDRIMNMDDFTPIGENPVLLADPFEESIRRMAEEAQSS